MAKKSQSLGSVILWLKGDTKDLFSKLDQAQKGVEKWARDSSRWLDRTGKSLKDVGTSMSVMGAAGAAALVPLVSGAMDFDKAMRLVNTMTRLSEADFENLENQVLDMSKSVGVDAVQAAEALYDAVSAGVPQDNVVSFMGTAAKTAIAGATDMKTAVNGLTNIMQAWKMKWEDAAQVSDKMFKIVERGKLTYQDLAQGISKVSVVAAQVGISIDQVGAAITTLTKQGVPASEAMTQVQAAIKGLISPNEYLLPLIKKMGYESGEVMIKQLGLQGALQKVRDAAEQMGVKMAQGSIQGTGAASKLLGSVEALGAAFAMTGENSNGFNEDLKLLSESAGTMEGAFKEMEKALVLDKVIANLKVFAIQLGNVLLPEISKILPQVTQLIQSGLNWIKLNPNLTKNLLLLTAGFTAFNLVLGPVVFAVGSLLTSMSSMVTVAPMAFGAVSKAATWMAEKAGTSVLGLAGSIAGATFAVTGLYLAFKAFAEMLGSGNWTTNFLTRWVDETFPKVGAGIDWVFDKVVGVVNELSDLFSWWWGDLKKGFSYVGNFIADVFKTAINGVIEAMNVVIAGINTVSGAVGIPEIPEIPAFRNGGVTSRTGWAIVGEGGPEVAHFPAGTRIYNNTQSRAMATSGGLGGGLTINGPLIQGAVIREEADIRKIAQEIVREMDRRKVALGML